MSKESNAAEGSHRRSTGLLLEGSKWGDEDIVLVQIVAFCAKYTDVACEFSSRR